MNKPIKQKKCKMCPTMFTPMSSLSKVCGLACALDYAEKDVKVKSEKAAKKQKKEFYEQDISWQHAQCKLVFNKLRRLQEFKWFKDRGLEPTCISCGKPLGGDVWACGHMRSVGASGALRYDPMNTYLQHNKRCNSALSGNINGTATTHGYHQGLINRFGAEEAKRIIDYCETKNEPVKWVWKEMKVWRQNWNKEIRELEKYLELV